MANTTSTKSSGKRKTVLALITLLAIVLGYVSYNVMRPFHIKDNKTKYVLIDDNTNFNGLMEQLRYTTNLSSPLLFKIMAKAVNYPSHIKSGRYAAKNNMDMVTFLRNLKNGKQTPVSLKFNNIRTKADLAGRLSQQLMTDSITLLKALSDSAVINKYGFTPDNITAMFIPNTYEIYWNTPLDKFFDRMHKEYNTFWDDERKNKAEKLGMTPIEISTLASIVEEEARYFDEYPIIARLYMNRLNKGMKLESDPTVKFAVGDFSLKRIYSGHLQKQSPYNTYLNIGLPPGPIRIPSIKGIDATLSPAQNNYLFMCAKEDLSGRHNYAETFAEHRVNAERYRKALNERGIK